MLINMVDVYVSVRTHPIGSLGKRIRKPNKNWLLNSKNIVNIKILSRTNGILKLK